MSAAALTAAGLLATLAAEATASAAAIERRRVAPGPSLPVDEPLERRRRAPQSRAVPDIDARLHRRRLYARPQ